MVKKTGNFEIEVIPTRKDKIKQPDGSKADIIPRLNSSILFIGASGSGKTTVLANLMTKKEMFRNCFDRILLVSPTAKTDDIQKYLELDDDDIVDDLKEAPKIINELMKDQKELIENDGADKADMIAIIFDDCVADNDLLKTPEFVKCFIACRHYNFTTLICSQSYKSVPRKCRLQANNIIYFKGSQSENEVILEDRCPPNMSKKTGLSLIDFATKEDFSFLHINMRVDFKTRYRRNFTEIINLPSNEIEMDKTSPEPDETLAEEWQFPKEVRAKKRQKVKK